MGKLRKKIVADLRDFQFLKETLCVLCELCVSVVESSLAVGYDANGQRYYHLCLTREAHKGLDLFPDLFGRVNQSYRASQYLTSSTSSIRGVPGSKLVIFLTRPTATSCSCALAA